ncbi:hypothetical protein GCM10022377_02710 [Zhihengliuella alba]|uniref:Glycosyltransferase subfamily 4-like N-terminal domain-containing protein n=1 Tax=Zhihengliuella alba TaxID=547018 RepID=A0ABP7CMW3_9MICC
MTHGQRPHMAMLVGNLVVGDSRVLKSAESAVKAGYRVTIVGERNRTVTSFGAHEDIPVYRLAIPFERTIRHQAEVAFGSASNAWRSRLLGAMLGEDDVDADAVERRHRRPAATSAPLTRAALAARRALTADALTGRAGPLGGGRYRRLWPQIEDYEEAFLRALVALEPDLVHVHDRHPLPAADTYAAWRAEQGRPVRWVYDAHEWLPGVHFAGGPAARAAWLAAERDTIRRADAVISVSDELADRMQRRHRLPERPAVVVNAPSAGRHPMEPADRRTLREECGLDAATPLLVYVGKLSESRGILDAVAALAHLPGVHLAFVANRDPRLRERLRAAAAELGVADRVHLHDYVPARHVTWYASSATVGLSPLHPTTAHEAALPTKIREYIQSGLPPVVSDLAAQASFVREHGIGTVHRPADPEDLARAVSEALDGAGRYRERLTEDFVRGHTWEGSEPVLQAVWSGLHRVHATGAASDPVHATGAASDARDADDGATASAEAPAGDVPPPRCLVVGPATPGVRTVLTVAADLAGDPADDSTDDSADAQSRPPFASIARPAAPERADLHGQLDGLPEAAAVVAEIARGTRSVVLGDALPALNGHAGSPLAERLVLEALGARTAAILDPDALYARARLRAAHPAHPLVELDGAGATRYDQQTARTREGLRHGQWPVLTWGELAARQFPEAVWLPYPAPRAWSATSGWSAADDPAADDPSASRAPGSGPDVADGAARVLIAGVRRSTAENRRLAEASAAWRTEGCHVVELPAFTPGSAVPQALLESIGGRTVLVDALASGEPSPVAVMAWAHGLTVVGGTPHPLREDLARTAPLLVTDLDALQQTVLRAVADLADQAAAQDRRAAALDYVERVHRQEFLTRLSRALGTP